MTGVPLQDSSPSLVPVLVIAGVVLASIVVIGVVYGLVSGQQHQRKRDDAIAALRPLEDEEFADYTIGPYYNYLDD